MNNVVLGVDIGGSGIKGAPVDTATGELIAERFRLDTPLPATPDAVVETVAAVAAHFHWSGPIGAGFPAVIKNGVVHTAANIDKHWIGQNAERLIRDATQTNDNHAVRVLNDAGAAGLAEMRFGEGRGVSGLVLMITLGTGIGTALFASGVLVPNTELGHIQLHGHGEAEAWAADSARERENLKWVEWAERVETYLREMEKLFWPDLIIVGGGVSKRADKWLPFVKLHTPLVTAALKNEAGIVGAAVAAGEVVS